MSGRNQDLVKGIYEAFSGGDVDQVMSRLSDDIQFQVSGRGLVSGNYAGKQGVLEFIGKLMELSEGTFGLEVLDVLANEFRAVALTVETARRNGRTLLNRAVHVWEIGNGKCTSFHGYNEEAWDEFWV